MIVLPTWAEAPAPPKRATEEVYLGRCPEGDWYVHPPDKEILTSSPPQGVCDICGKTHYLFRLTLPEDGHP